MSGENDRSAHADDRSAYFVAKGIGWVLGGVLVVVILVHVDLPSVSFPDLPTWDMIERGKNWVFRAVFAKVLKAVFAIMVFAIIAGGVADRLENRRNRDRADTGDQAPDGHRL